MMKRKLLCMTALLAMMASSAVAQGGAGQKIRPPSLWIDQLTWLEVKEAVENGYTNVIIPSAGIEQYGIHLPLGKNALVVRTTATHIAEALGDTLIAPVVDMVPDWELTENVKQSQYAGTITIPRKIVADVLEHTARSLYRFGFQQVFFIGDSEGNQLAQSMVARTLSTSGKLAYNIDAYLADEEQVRVLGTEGYARESIGGHGGLPDSSEVAAVAPGLIRTYRQEAVPQNALVSRGAWGDNKMATPEIGQRMLQVKVRAAVREICTLALESPPACATLR